MKQNMIAPSNLSADFARQGEDTAAAKQEPAKGVAARANPGE